MDSFLPLIADNNAFFKKSIVILSGNYFLRNVDLPVLRGPHRKADWLAGKSRFRTLGMLTILDSTPILSSFLGTTSNARNLMDAINFAP